MEPWLAFSLLLIALLVVFFRWVLPEPEEPQQEGDPWAAPPGA